MKKCADCGYLAKQNKNNDELEAADERLRTTGVPNHLNKYDGCPKCFVQAFNLETEIGERDAANVLHVITLDRPCNDHVPWQPGNSPKEHKAMMDNKWRTEFERKILEEDRAWREQIRKEDLEWKSRQDEMVRKEFAETAKHNRKNFWVIGVVGMIVVAVVQIACALIQATLSSK